MQLSLDPFPNFRRDVTSIRTQPRVEFHCLAICLTVLYHAHFMIANKHATQTPKPCKYLMARNFGSGRSECRDCRSLRFVPFELVFAVLYRKEVLFSRACNHAYDSRTATSSFVHLPFCCRDLVFFFFSSAGRQKEKNGMPSSV